MSERKCVMHGALEVEWYTEDVPDLDGEPRCYVCELEKRVEIAERRNKDPYTVDSTHTDPAEKETAECLKYRQRARAAEEALRVVETKDNIMYTALEILACLGNGCYYGNSEGNVIAREAIAGIVAINDKQLEDILLQGNVHFLPKCSYRENVGTVGMCRDKESNLFNKPCSKSCETPTKGDQNE